MTEQEIDDVVSRSSHCSAIVRLTPDLTELYSAHTTWTGYFSMLRYGAV